VKNSLKSTPNALEDDLKEFEDDYAVKSAEIEGVRQQIRETGDLDQKERLRIKEKRLRQERRNIYEKINAIKLELDAQKIKHQEPRTPQAETTSTSPLDIHRAWIVESTPSWIRDFQQPQPFIRHHSQISNILNGYDPFPDYVAEHELAFLFGQVGGFWSQHPTYVTISSNFLPEIILADRGGGKTAFVCALSQIGDIEGNPLKGTFPIFMTGDSLTLKNAQNQFAKDLLDFVYTNPSRLPGLNRTEKKFLARLLVNGVGVDLVKVRLSQILETDKDFVDIIEQVKPSSRVSQERWLPQAQQCLKLLGFTQALLALDFNQGNTRSLKTWLRNMQRWANYSIIIKLFLPKHLQEDFSEFLDRIKTSTCSQGYYS
jgi:hypothetical protein